MPRATSSLQRVSSKGRPHTMAEVAEIVGVPAASGFGEMSVTGVNEDSRRVEQGDLYAALPGARTHGARFAADAVRAGAVAILTDAEGDGLVASTVRDLVPVLVVDTPRLVLGALSASLNDDPTSAVAVLGVTGTNGKTTVTSMAHHLMRGLGVGAGMIGTITVRTNDDEVPATSTTPEAPQLQRLLRQMREAGVDAVALEVSSHAVALHRIDGARFAVLAFTNLSRDHLDFHHDMTDYFEAKARLFTAGYGDDAVICVDDDAGRQMAQRARDAGMSVLTVSGRAGSALDADVSVSRVDAAADGSQRFQLRGPFGAGSAAEAYPVALSMPGSYNAINAAVALTCVYRLLTRHLPVRAQQLDTAPQRVGMSSLIELMGHFPGVAGRMERIVDPLAQGRTPLVVVDYAHTPEALATVLTALRPPTAGRLVVVFGAGGERDIGKRGPMGASAATHADIVVVTDDNPRSESAAGIRAAVMAGAMTAAGRRAGDIVEVADRAGAVARALAACTGPADTVLISGKGHETGQDYGAGDPVDFDDRVVAAAALRAWAVEAGVVDRPPSVADPISAPVLVAGPGGGEVVASWR